MAIVVAVLAWAAPARAGGWAVSTLDEWPAPVAGRPVTVGFTIRQHGETPVDLDDVGVEVATGGSTQRFPATNDGTGHYVATITLPTAGDHEWTIHQGWFAPQALGTVTVSAAGGDVPTAATTGPTTTEGRTDRWLPYGLGLAALVSAVVALLDAVAGRRRRTRPAVA